MAEAIQLQRWLDHMSRMPPDSVPRTPCNGHHRERGTERGPKRHGGEPLKRISKAEAFNLRQFPEQQQAELDGGPSLFPYVPDGTERID